ncbi:MAG: ClpXP protease specificity-enhancing factor SspB [Alphaproteobacteria bacterium]
MATKITLIDYEQLVQDSLRGVIRTVLTNTAKTGLVGSHHFYISFATNHPDVDIPNFLKEEYPEEVTIVLQYEFWDLEVEDDFFSVTLCFNNVDERLTVPFSAVVSFVDPSVKFGLQFTPSVHERVPSKKTKKTKAEGATTRKPRGSKTAKTDTEAPKAGSNIIAFDAFRNKKK